MNNQINLLPKTDTHVEANLKRYLILRYVAVGCMSLIVCFAIVLFLLIQFSSLPVLRADENRLLLNMTHYDATVAKLFLYNERMNQVNSLVAPRLPYDKNIAIVSSQLPPDVSLSAYSIKDKAVTLTVVSPSLQSLDTFITKLDGLASANKARNISMTTLGSTDGNVYTMSISLSLL